MGAVAGCSEIKGDCEEILRRFQALAI
ncbi:hypothetical protein CCACVL1_25464 [Corchorus capsularis]|uniref:Uncharacterized protein n=1 Tax=Corchorus capsularis TaxID=210143 RepID=A0A1R3GK00_COCAP|nr:hypothetical protein CCACVL1_25464 [Corchorus capsularis]